jgi:hypothetical protein
MDSGSVSVDPSSQVPMWVALEVKPRCLKTLRQKFYTPLELFSCRAIQFS